MKSKRLLAIASLINEFDSLVDIGCDHGYLGIYLKEKNPQQQILLSDISKQALDSARKNIAKKKLDIPLIISDGLKNIDTKNLNTIVISGMGSYTILKILSDENKLKTIEKLIIQSNNHQEILRTSLLKKGYYLQKELTIIDQGIWYIIGMYTKDNINLTKEELKYGLISYDKIDYFQELIQEKEKILKQIPQDILEYKTIKKEIKELNKLLKKCQSITC